MNELDENQDYKSYPVEVRALEVNWILNTDQGLQYLQALYTSENLDIFNQDSIKMLAEFYYYHYKKSILKIRLPAYLVQMAIFYLSVVLFETVKESKSIKDKNLKITLNGL